MRLWPELQAHGVLRETAKPSIVRRRHLMQGHTGGGVTASLITRFFGFICNAWSILFSQDTPFYLTGENTFRVTKSNL